PPVRWFGLFSALGLGAALFFAWTTLPASLMLLPVRGPRHLRLRRWAIEGPLAAGLRRFAVWCYDHPRSMLLLGLCAVAVGAVGAWRVRANQSMGSAFKEESAIIRADRALNRLFQGTYFLDVLITGEKPGDILRPEVLRKIEELESYART